MHEPNICDGSRDKSFHRSHGETLNRSCGGEGSERLRFGSPKTRNHKQYRCHDVDRPLANFNGEGIADKTGHGDGNDARALKTECELLQGDVELLGEGSQRGSEQRTDRYSIALVVC